VGRGELRDDAVLGRPVGFWENGMKIKVALVILLQGFAYGSARADDGRCEAPPYGASMEAYRAFVVETRQSGEAGSPEAQKVPGEVLAALAKVCRIKYEAADRTELYRAGFTPQDIDRSSTVMLAAEYLGVLKYVAFQGLAHGQREVKPGASIPPPDEYQPVSVRDFLTDGAKLATDNATVSLTGSYIFLGNRGVLYENIQAVIKMKSHPEAGPQPNVPLLTDDASPRARRRLLACQTDPSAAQVGCTVTLRGQVTLCRLPDAPAAAPEGPCVKVDDGK
jgi:hypothetical protein